MLAQNFKTPADLQITDAEFEALVKVLGMLEREEIRHDPLLPTTNMANGFNMQVWKQEFECGTAACIAGWAQIVARPRKVFTTCNPGYAAKGLLPALRDLFGCGMTPSRLKEINQSHAAIALRNYLTFGEPRWKEAMAEG